MADSVLRSVLFHGFSDQSRVRILEELLEGTRRVTDLVTATGLTQPNVSNHLACLFDCGLVDRERQGREVHYSLAPGVSELFAAADAILARSGDRIACCRRYGLAAQQVAA